MGFLARLFGRGPAREEWISISTSMARTFEEFRKQWFKSYVSIIEQFNTCNSELKIPIVHRSLEVDSYADIGIMHFQLFTTFRFIRNRHYIPIWRRGLFDGILLAQICGTKFHPANEVEDLLLRSMSSRYLQMYSDPDRAFVSIATSIVGYISGKDQLESSRITIPDTLLKYLVDKLLGYGLILDKFIANVFGDKAIVQEIESALNQLNKAPSE